MVEAELDQLVAAGQLSPEARVDATFLVWSAVHGLATLLADGLITSTILRLPIDKLNAC